MITKEELKSIARFSKLKPHQQEKHYVQAIILNSIYSTIKDELVFKGGTALFFICNLPRFSEDLDFTMIKQINKEAIMSNINKDLEMLGIKSKISNIEENHISFSFRVDAEGPLFTKEIERCYVRCEISKRENVENVSIREIKSIYPDIPNFSVCLMKEEEILAEKIRALLTRNKARDLFDLYFLLKMNTKIDFQIIDKKLAYYNENFKIKELNKKINNMKNIWEAELIPFIIGELPDFNEVKTLVLSRIKVK